MCSDKTAGGFCCKSNSSSLRSSRFVIFPGLCLLVQPGEQLNPASNMVIFFDYKYLKDDYSPSTEPRVAAFSQTNPLGSKKNPYWSPHPPPFLPQQPRRRPPLSPNPHTNARTCYIRCVERMCLDDGNPSVASAALTAVEAFLAPLAHEGEEEESAMQGLSWMGYQVHLFCGSARTHIYVQLAQMRSDEFVRAPVYPPPPSKRSR